MKLLYCLLYCGMLGLISFLVGRILPSRWFQAQKHPYRSLPFENEGKFYERFGIRKWQNRVPDMSKLFPGLMQPKKMTKDFSSELPLMIRETCIAEFIHGLLCILALPCLLIWPGWGGVLFLLLYILGNLPFIMIQRYNRPRLLHLQSRMERRRKENHP